jgi:hypothetical protein
LRHTGTERQFIVLVGELVPDAGFYALEDAGYEAVRVPSVPTIEKVQKIELPFLIVFWVRDVCLRKCWCRTVSQKCIHPFDSLPTLRNRHERVNA